MRPSYSVPGQVMRAFGENSSPRPALKKFDPPSAIPIKSGVEVLIVALVGFRVGFVADLPLAGGVVGA